MRNEKQLKEKLNPEVKQDKRRSTKRAEHNFPQNVETGVCFFFIKKNVQMLFVIPYFRKNYFLIFEISFFSSVNHTRPIISSFVYSLNIFPNKATPPPSVDPLHRSTAPSLGGVALRN